MLKVAHKKALSMVSTLTPVTAVLAISALALLVAASSYALLGILHAVTLTATGRSMLGEWTHFAPSVPALGVANGFDDNLAGISYLERELNPFPIDVVYTWVNGSDARLQQTLREFKIKMKLNKEEEDDNETNGVTTETGEEGRRNRTESNSTFTRDGIDTRGIVACAVHSYSARACASAQYQHSIALLS
jgi:hypothetical protein